MDFTKWMARTLGQDVRHVRLLLRKPLGRNFLITWSILESRCFNGFVRKSDLEGFVGKAIKLKLDEASFKSISQHFHNRYQNKRLYANLCYKDSFAKVDAILKKDFGKLRFEDHLLLVVYTIYRFRNNIFHGNKPVETWLRYEPEIKLCIESMQMLIDDMASPTMKAIP